MCYINDVNVSVIVIAQVLHVLYTDYSNTSIEILLGTRRFFPIMCYDECEEVTYTCLCIS